jgi:hypothetical protein
MPKVREGRIALDAVVIDENYLSRAKPNTRVIEEYAEALINGAVFPPIILEEGTNKLLSGYHRTKAYVKYAELQGVHGQQTTDDEQCDLWPAPTVEIDCEFHTIPDEQSPKLYAYGFNKANSLRQSTEDARMVCLAQYEMFPGCGFRLLMAQTGLSEPTIRKYLASKMAEFEETRQASIQRLARLGWTQEETAEALKRQWPEGTLSRSRLSEILSENEKFRMSTKEDLTRGLTPETIAKRAGLPALLVWALTLEGKPDHERFEALDLSIHPYDVLHFQGCDDRFGTDAYPGRIPGQLIAHILYWFTKPGDYVIDPMAGGGTVPDVCLAMGRKCYAYDINQSGRIDIIPHNLATDGWPERTKKADLIFWDPPYFSKKDADYPEGSISRLERGAYLDFFKKTFTDAKQLVKRGTTLAFLMSDWNDDHDAQPKRPGIFLWDYVDLLRHAGWHMQEHIQVPLSTQQVDPRTVIKFRDEAKRARLERYLLIATA